MSKLILSSLQIKGYRCFEDLVVDKLGRINLIVGKNSVGKTAFLEALWIYTEPNPQTLYDIAISRNESPAYFADQEGRRIMASVHSWSIRHLFFGRPLLQFRSPDVEFSVGSLNLIDEPSLSVKASPPGSNLAGDSPTLRFQLAGLHPNEARSLNGLFVRLGGLEGYALTRLWDEIDLTDKQDDVKRALRIIDPEIQDVSFIGYPKGVDNRVPVARVNGVKEPVPLASMGEGMNRLLGVILALVNCKDGLLLVDEVESGLHYSVLPDIWRLIFRTARELNVQVFATTHSSDCIQAFERAAEEDKDEEAVLIRLERQGEKIGARVIDERLLGIATKSEIEVR